jgi:hypothetical protein
MPPPPRPPPIGEVSPEEFKRTNKGLITVLSAVAEAGKDGITTRKLFEKIRMFGYGETMVEKAYRLGYIRRDPPEPPAWRKEFPAPRYNIITPKGKKLLAQLGY